MRRSFAPSPPARFFFAAARPAVSLGLTLGRGMDALFDVMERNRQRRALRALPDYLLKDAGLSRADIEREASKPFWKP